MIDPVAIAKVKKRQKAQASQVLGRHGEDIVHRRLIAHGFKMVEKINVGWRKAALRWVPCARVSGDFRAVEPGTGRSVLVEVKMRDDRLYFSDFQRHQSGALTNHEMAGGLSLVAWISQHGVAIMNWRVMDFTKRSSLTWEQAQECLYLGRNP